MEGRESEGPKLLLNQGPSEPCYATDPTVSHGQIYSVLTVCIYGRTLKLNADIMYQHSI